MKKIIIYGPCFQTINFNVAFVLVMKSFELLFGIFLRVFFKTKEQHTLSRLAMN